MWSRNKCRQFARGLAGPLVLLRAVCVSFKTVREQDKIHAGARVYARTRRHVPSHVAVHVNMREYVRTCKIGSAYLHTDPEVREKLEEERRCKYEQRTETLNPP